MAKTPMEELACVAEHWKHTREWLEDIVRVYPLPQRLIVYHYNFEEVRNIAADMGFDLRHDERCASLTDRAVLFSSPMDTRKPNMSTLSARGLAE
jgi:hypothetical protein